MTKKTERIITWSFFIALFLLIAGISMVSDVREIASSITGLLCIGVSILIFTILAILSVINNDKQKSDQDDQLLDNTPLELKPIKMSPVLITFDPEPSVMPNFLFALSPAIFGIIYIVVKLSTVNHTSEGLVELIIIFKGLLCMGLSGLILILWGISALRCGSKQKSDSNDNQ